MAISREILSIEAINKNRIYLYEHAQRWYAYEHSAYHFSLLFKMGEVVWLDDRIGVAIGQELDFLYSKSMCLVEITSVTNNEVKINCNTSFEGFDQWKQEQLFQ